ncbi:MAG: asparagine synthase-related protein, partial [Bacteroidota bacterium]
RLTKELSTKAVLTGEGADELFIGYPHLVGGGLESLLSVPYRLLDSVYAKLPGLKRFKEKRAYGLPFHDALRHAANGEYASWNFQDDSIKYDFLPPSERSKHLQSFNMLNSHLLSLLWRNDRMGMMHGVESRFPFLDERVVQFALNLPYKHKVALVSKFSDIKHPFKSGKHLVRLVASRYLPNQVAFGSKKGFPVEGLQKLEVNNLFFENGYWARSLDLNKSGLNNFFSNLDSYNKALFGMVEIWGKLFIDSNPIDEVRATVLRSFDYKD